ERVQADRGGAARIGIGACGECGVAHHGCRRGHSMVDCDCSGRVVFDDGVAASAQKAGRCGDGGASGVNESVAVPERARDNHGMTQQALDLLQKALSLSEEERADLACSLMESLDAAVDEGAESAWSEEINRRITELD